MMDIVKIENLKGLVIEIRGEKFCSMRMCAVIYGVETKRVNEAVKITLISFLVDTSWSLIKTSGISLKSKFSTSKERGKSKASKRIYGKGLYMLATILKSPQATISIVETFSKIRELSRSIKELSTFKIKRSKIGPCKKAGVKKRERLHYALRASTPHIFAS